MTTIEHRILNEMTRITTEYKLELTFSQGRYRQVAYAMNGFTSQLNFTYEFGGATGAIRFGGAAAERWHLAHPDDRRWYDHRVNSSMSYSGGGVLPSIEATFRLYRDLLTLALIIEETTAEQETQS